MNDKLSLLAHDLTIEPSQLVVRDLQKLTTFYRETIKLEVLLSTANRTILGHDGVPVLELVSQPDYSMASPRSAGLFHNAIVYSSRSSLAETIYHILQTAPESYEGSADHLVSEAFYFHDPENNGLELYFDRPRSEWRWQAGRVMMDTIYLDPVKYISDHLNHKSKTSKNLGHVHLKVGDVATARKFYVEQLGFDITADMGSALFVSVGGYHHHLAMNTWLSQGASKRDPRLGLGEIKLLLPDDGSIDRLADRLNKAKINYTEDGSAGLRVNDPWNNRLLFTID